MNARSRGALVLASALVVALAAVAGAGAHAKLSPPVSLAQTGQLYSLAVPTEKEGTQTTKVILTVPSGFSIDSFVPAPGWDREVQSTGSGEDAVIQKVTWTGGRVPTGEDAFFQFMGRSGPSGTYTFQVEQTYSDGSLVDWAGAEGSDTPSPTIETKSSFSGGSSTLSVVALVVGAVALILAIVGLVARGGRQVA